MNARRLLVACCVQSRLIVTLALMMMLLACGEGIFSVTSFPFANDAGDSSSNDAASIDSSFLDDCENCLSDMNGNDEFDDAPDDPEEQTNTENLDEADAQIALEIDASDSGCSNSCETIGEQKCIENGISTCIKDGVQGCLIWDIPIACNENQICDAQKVACVEACGDYCEPFSLILLPPYYKDPCDYIGLTQIIQDNLSFQILNLVSTARSL